MKAATGATLPDWSARRMPEEPQPTRPRAELLAPAPELVEGWQVSQLAAEFLALARRYGGRVPLHEAEALLRCDRDSMLDAAIELIDAKLARTQTGGPIAYLVAIEGAR